MRRCLHSFLVGVLTLSLTMDTARACWHARRGCRVPMPVATPCPPFACAPCPPAPAAWAHAGGCVVVDVVVISDVAVDGAYGMPLVGHGCGCGAPVIETVDMIVEGAVVVTSPAETVGGASPRTEAQLPSQPTPAEQVVAPPSPVEPPVAPPVDVAPEVAAEPNIPALEPAGEPAVDEVRQTTALTEEQPQTEEMPPSPEDETAPVEEPSEVPLGEEPPPPAAAEEEPAPMAEEEMPPADDVPAESEPAAPEPAEPVPAEPAEPAEPQAPEEPNIFEEVDAGAIDEAAEPVEPEAAEPAPLDEPMDEAEADGEMPAEEGAEPAVEGTNAAVDEGEPAAEPALADEETVTTDDESASADPEPTGGEDQPAADAAAGEEPAAVADPFDSTTRSREPSRRWIDRTGRYAVVGTLVTVRADGTCVLAAGDRLLVVPLDGLSGHDRDYAKRAATRLAAARAAAPETGDTAGI